ncbi:MFS general substrate transporter [Mrakia frigida]|uniref:MFS general substrate transporter n=1 Tax=Mrakia frigida TaxID=29902 RepID=UPI003FCC1E33
MEKGDKTEIEQVESINPQDIAFNYEIDEAKLLRKIDWTLIPWLSVLYLLSFLDRTAIGNAATFGLRGDLGLSDDQYLICLTVFFFTYSLFEPPSNVLLKKLSPRLWLSGIMFFWGICMLAQGIVTNYYQLLAVRLLLGLTEAGLFPGVTFYLSCYYKREEYGFRAALFFSAATISGAFGGLLAAAIQNMDGVGGYEGWRWILILEGILTVVCACVSPWLIQDFPDTAKFLTEPERAFVIARLKESSGDDTTSEKFSWGPIMDSLRDWKTYIGMVIYAGSVGPLYAFSLFTPSIINSLGFTAVKANLLSVPIYTFACIVTVGLGFWADRTRNRGKYNLIFMAVGLVGYTILMVSTIPALSYFAVFLAASGIYPLIPNTIAWVSNNTEGAYKRSLTLGMVIGFGNLNGAVSSNVYRAKDKPRYIMGHGLVLAYIAIGFLGSLLYMILLKRENARRDRGERNEIIDPSVDAEFVTNEKVFNSNGQRVFRSDEQARKELGDQHSSFRYVI